MARRSPPPLRLAAGVLALALAPAALAAEDASTAGLEAYKARVEAEIEAALATTEPAAPQHLTPCVGGFAGGYPCSGIDLLEFLPVSASPRPPPTASGGGPTR